MFILIDVAVGERWCNVSRVCNKIGYHSCSFLPLFIINTVLSSYLVLLSCWHYVNNNIVYYSFLCFVFNMSVFIAIIIMFLEDNLVEYTDTNGDI